MLKESLKYYIIFILIAIIAMGLYFLSINKSICIFYNIYHIPCPACGTTRAYISLLKGDLISSFKNHPLWWIVPFIPLIVSIKEIKWSYLLLGLYIVVWIVRLIVTYPTFY